MPLEIKVGPPQLAIHQGHAVLITEPDGQVLWPTDKGLYFFDTRLVSAYALYANGAVWDLVNSGAVTSSAARIFMTNRAFPGESGPIAARTLSLVLDRTLDGGLHEQFAITHYGRAPVRFNLEIAIRSDFADVFEVKSGRIVRRGRIMSEWSQADQSLHTSYRNGDFVRALHIAARGPSPAVYANGRISFDIELAPSATWCSSLLYDLDDCG